MGANYGCILTQGANKTSADGFYNTLLECKTNCPVFGKELSWKCAETGNCVVAAMPPDPSQGRFSSFIGCSNSPRCFAPGTANISYECFGGHFGCVEKNATPDGKTSWPTVEACETKCRSISRDMAFVCGGSGGQSQSCVLLKHTPSRDHHFFDNIDSCNDFCN